MNYNKNTRPSYGNQTEVGLFLTVNHIDLDELNGVVNLYGWMKMSWKDEKLQWNTSDYSGYEILRISGYEIWQPNLIVYNRATGNDIDHFGNTFVHALYSGMIFWVPPFQTSFFCELDFRYWPFDTQNCSLILGSWIVNDTEMTLKKGIYDKFFEITPFVNNNEWNIKNISVVDNIPKYSAAIQFNFILERRSPMYKAVVIIPASCIVLLALASFWLPPQSGEKIMLNGVNLVCITAFLVYFAQMLPTLAMNTPLIVLFYSSALILVSVSMMISVLVLFISSAKHRFRFPFILKKFLDGSFGKIFCLNQMTIIQQDESEKELQDQPFECHDVTDNSQFIDDRPRKRSDQHDWIVLAMAIDRFFFLVYSVIFIFLAAIYSV